MKRAYKYRIYPTQEQEVVLAKTFGCCRVVWNWARELKEKAYKEGGENLTTNTLIVRMKSELKAEKEWLGEVNSQSLQMSIRNLGTAYENFFKKRAAYPQFKSKFDRQSFQCPQHCSVDFSKGAISIPKANDIPAVLHRRFRGDIKTVTISKTPSGKYFASVLVETGIPEPATPTTSDARTAIGIDAGLKTFAVVSNGQEIATPHFAKQEERKLKLLQRRLSKKQKYSCAYRRVKHRIASLHERIANRRTDFLHKSTHQLTHESQVRTICVEDLNVKGMMRNHHLARSVADASISEFMRQLEYKCAWRGIRFVKTGRFDPSSQLCHVCGYRYRGLTLKVREWTCPDCGTCHDRDLNAAINIKNFGLGLNEALPSVRGKVKPVEQPPVDDRAHRVPKKQCCASADAVETGKERGDCHPEAAQSLVAR